MQQTNGKEIIGYCIECKYPIYEGENVHVEDKRTLCDWCYKVKHNILKEELNFD